MKGKVFIFFLVLLLFFNSAFARDIDPLEEQLNNLETQKIEEFLKRLNQTSGEYIPEIDFRDLINIFRKEGFTYDLRGLFSGLIKYLFKEIVANTNLLGKLIILAVILAILQNLQTAFEKDVIGKLAYGVCYLVIIGIGINSFIIASKIGKEAINNMVSFMQALLPMLLTLLVSLGGVTASAVFHPVVLMSVSAVSTLIKDLLIPIIFFSAIMAIVNNITNSFQLTRFSGLLKELCIAILGFLLSVFLGIMIVQGTAAAVVDGVSVRTAKFATKNFVPIVGGIFADAIDTVISCSLLLKNAIGVVGVIIVFIMCAFPVLKILSVIFIYKLAAALIQPIGDEKIVNSLNGLANSLIMLFVTVSSVAMMFFIAVTIIIGAGNITVMMR
mgnify:FL=1